MNDRAGSKGPKETVPHPGLGLKERAPQDDLASRTPWPEPCFGGPLPPEPYRSGFGDLFGGGVAAAALVVMIAIGLPLWLAIPLSVMTYIALALLRAPDEPSDQIASGVGADQSGAGATIEELVRPESANEAPISVDAMFAKFKLTRRELEILPLLAQRLTDREIAERLSISHRTAMNHTANILGKLGLASRRDVAAFVAQHGLLLPSTPPHEHG